MHIPDGFIDGKTAVTTAVLSVAGLGLALRQVKRELPARKVPLLGLAAAFVFAAQMINFPVVGGTSGHLMGSALVAALLGPAAAVVVISTVLIVQCFLFADGGVTALGASIFNMAIVGSIGGYAVYRFMCRLMPGTRGRVTGVAFAGWCSTMLASLCCAGQLAWSGTVSWQAGFAAMATIHALIGLGEGLIGALVLLAIERSRPDMIYDTSSDNNQGQPVGGFLQYGLLAAVGIAVFVAPFACPWPDGLEFVAQTLGFEHRAAEPMRSPVPDYEMPGIEWSAGATAAAGLSGVVAVFAMAWILGRVLVRDNARRSGNLPAE